MEFNLLGQKIVIQDQAEAELAALALRIVNEKVNEIQSTRPMLGPQQISVLALVELAGQLVKDRALIDQYRQELDLRCNALLRELTQATRSERPMM